MANGSKREASKTRSGSNTSGETPETAPFGAQPTKVNGMRLTRRRTASSVNAKGGNGGGGSALLLQFYANDSPGYKISSTFVIIFSVCFIAFVIGLHILGKLFIQNKA
ncbi:hypothetical protein KC19_11G014900 [Ceratodon purpureus]|uniref:Protein transport protein Sec61 subunit beta n=1 Tax=Ceratodon purpureus TaxID=3225 RepID=A0A8T0GBQ2_CERPU|nr:hypothetical protein KC19_11G014900 [Ceratodon purpureus]